MLILIAQPCKEKLGGEKGTTQFLNNKNSVTLNTCIPVFKWSQVYQTSLKRSKVRLSPTSFEHALVTKKAHLEGSLNLVDQ